MSNESTPSNSTAAPEENQVENTESLETVETSSAGDVVDEAKDVISDPTATKSEKKAAEKMLKKYELKIDGRSETMEIDLSNDDEVRKHLQLSKAAQKRMQETTDIRKSVDQFIDLLKKDPRKVLSDPNIGVDIKKFAQDIINEEIANSQKTPEQLEKENLQRELEELKNKYKKDEEDRKSSELTRLQKETEEKIESDISDALNTSDLPKSPYTVRKMAEIMMIALQNDIDLSPKDVVPLLKKQMKEDLKEMFSLTNDDVLEEFLGKDTISRLRKRNIAKAKQSVDTANSIKSSGNDVKPKDTGKEENKISIKDFLKL